MSCWRVLQLANRPQDHAIPQLLIKPQFGSNSYTVFVTDLSNIWSEELHLPDIVRRAAEVESPIEVSQHDTAQLAILFENVQKSLVPSDATSCLVTRNVSGEDVTLHTTISLPEPLESLTWRFHLHKKAAGALKDQLILPLLLSSQVQHERISSLLSIVSEKDRTITRLVDQYEASNLDLAAAFPSISNVKFSRRIVKREQAAKYIPGLQEFEVHAWKNQTSETVDADASTLQSFQEALSGCAPIVPSKLMSDDKDASWWEALGTDVPTRSAATKANVKAPLQTSSANSHPIVSESETEDETEDEFETHENFKSRDIPMKPESMNIAIRQDMAVDSATAGEGTNMNIDEDDSDDLDAPRKSQGQSRRALSQPESPTPESSPPEARIIRSPPENTKAKGFKIGGKSKRLEPAASISQPDRSKSLESREDIPTRPKTEEDRIATKPARKGFKIGGRSKTPIANESTDSQETKGQQISSTTTPGSPVKPPALTTKRVEKHVLAAEEKEETEEEKVERKRRELKRKNEELAKKQAQSKKKKRF